METQCHLGGEGGAEQPCASCPMQAGGWGSRPCVLHGLVFGPGLWGSNVLLHSQELIPGTFPSMDEGLLWWPWNSRDNRGFGVQGHFS